MDEILSATLGPETVIVDASKSLETWRVISAAMPGRVAAVHLVKDVRAYLDSTLGRMATMVPERLWAEQLARRPLRAHTMRALPQSLVYLLRWMRQNRAMERALAGGSTPWLRVGYEALCREYQKKDLDVAVRSSATCEDSATASFAGQCESYLNIHGAGQVLAERSVAEVPRLLLAQPAELPLHQLGNERLSGERVTSSGTGRAPVEISACSTSSRTPAFRSGPRTARTGRISTAQKKD